MNNNLFKGILLPFFLTMGCAERPHAPQLSAAQVQPPPKTQDFVPESFYSNILYHLKGSAETGFQYRIQSTKYKEIGVTKEGSRTLARFLIAIGVNHRYEAKYVENDLSEASDGAHVWSAERTKMISGFWSLTQNAMILSGLGEISADPKNPERFFEVKIAQDLLSPGLKNRTYGLYSDTRQFPPFEDLKP